ncbi:MAG: LacI family DNA-binding transcriptional regulator [Opitutales bacterium]|nr:LacI family DNA-binding transcriptional regulator [Opitutales bacterium]
MRTKPRATITEVAKAAGVATGTVSRVFNNHADVHEDIRARVHAAAAKLGYVRLRQRKRSRAGGDRAKTGNIGVVCFGMEDALVHLPVVSTALQGIERSLSAEGRSVLFANIPDGERVPPFLADDHVGGLILKGPNQGNIPSPAKSELVRSINRYPHVWLMGRPLNARGDHVNFSTLQAGQFIAEHLRERGHRRVAFFNPKPGQVQFEQLKAAFYIAATQLGLEYSLLESPPPDTRIWPLPAITLIDNVRHLVEEWAALPAKKRPTALFVPSDRTAVQLYSVLNQTGLHVAKDVSVISCNNEESLVMNLHPAVTTIDVQADLIGHLAVDQLSWRVEHPEVEQDIQVLVTPKLIVRDSVAQL